MLSGLDKILKKIQSEADTVFGNKVREAEKSAALLVEDKMSEAALEKASILKKAEADAVAVRQRIRSTTNLEGKKKRLAAKQNVVAAAFDAAYQRLTSMPENELVTIIVSMAAGEIKTGTEEILLPLRFQNAAPDFETKLRQKVPAFTGSIRYTGLVTEAGCIVKSGEIEVNKTFAALLRQHREELEDKVVSVLF